MDGSKQMGPNRQIQIDRFRQTDSNKWVQKDGFQKLGQTYRSKQKAPIKEIQIKTTMSLKLECP